jgi:hypothetical protein
MPGHVPRPTPIYRLIHIDNLDACLVRGTLYSPNHTPEDGHRYRTIHRHDVQESRRTRPVPKGPGGTVHDYVGFYLGPRSVMLYQLQTGWVEGYNEGQEPLIHVVSTCQVVEDAGLGFVFSDGHGLARFTAWYDALADLEKVDWDATYAIWWKDAPEDMDRQRRKQAEFLVHRSFPWGLVTEIGVFSESMRARVEGLLTARGLGHTVPVRIRAEWYY